MWHVWHMRSISPILRKSSFYGFMFLLHMIKWLCCYVQNVDEVMYVTELCIEEIGNEKNGYHISLLGCWGSKYVEKTKIMYTWESQFSMLLLDIF